MRRRILMFTCLILAFSYTHTPTAAYAQINGYYRQPSIRGNTIVFVSEGDLWKVEASGGVAQRLTTNLADETNPQISPDGKTIAFTGRYDGVADVYSMPILGGTPQRHSWDAGAVVVGWTNDNKILYATTRYSTLPNAQLVIVDPLNNSRRLLPLAQAWDGGFDGATLFFTRNRPQGSNTKRYKGGTAQNIWKFAQITQNKGDFTEAVPLTSDYTGTSRGVRVWGGRVYFVSDRDGVMNIWSMDENGKNLVQHTFHKDYDVREFSIDNGRIVYQQGADLWTMSPTQTPTSPPTRLSITVSSDLDQMRARVVKKPVDFLTDYHIDKAGDRVALIARGIVFVAPVGQGRFVALPNTGGVRYREMRFAPDGKSLYTLNDRSGEVEVWATPANGVGVGTQLTKGGDILRYDLEVSPDGRYIAHDDKNQRLYLYDATAKSNKLIAENKWDGFGYWWSPDSKYVVYRTGVSNQNQVLSVYDVASGTTTAITSDRYDSNNPAFTPDGAWLYFLSDRTFTNSVGSPWGARQPEPYFNNQTKIYAIQLKKGAKFPFAPKTELDLDSAAAAKVASIQTPIQSNAPLYEVPIPAGNYGSLRTDGKRLYYMARDDRFSGGTTKLMSLELKNEDIKAETFAEELRGGFELSGDRKKILFRKADDLYVVPAGAKAPAELAKNKVDLSGWMMQLERKSELTALFLDAWRLERDYFYDANMHGLDWAAMKTKYLPLAARVGDRSELSDVIAQMVGELSALHIFVSGGDLRAGLDTIPHAWLGARLEPAAGSGTGTGSAGWRVAHIYQNDPDLLGELSPLAQAGVEVSEGDVIVSINGVPLSSVQHPSELLMGKAGKQVLLELANGKKAIVLPITSAREASLRYGEWEYTRRLAVDKLSGGRIGYVHLRAMGGNDFAQFARDFYPQYNKDALIIDMRNNNGGNIDSWVLEKLMRRPWFYWQPRVGEPSWNMQYAFRGPMATIINEWSSSDGEAFPEGFRRLGLGKLVGTRTWGGEIWLSSQNVLADRGIATAAETGVFADGKWLIEGHGVDPDVVVDNLPASTFGGSDAQLEATVKLLLEEVTRRPNPVPRSPAYPKKNVN